MVLGWQEMPVEPNMSPREISARIRNKVADLNDDLLLAAIAEVDVEFQICDDDGIGRTELRVWCSQEV